MSINIFKKIVPLPQSKRTALNDKTTVFFIIISFIMS